MRVNPTLRLPRAASVHVVIFGDDIPEDNGSMRVHLLFEQPNPENPDLRFVEAETPEGKSINVGEWSKQGEYQVLKLDTITPMSLEGVLQRLYDTELSCSISWLWDGGIEVKLGDELNGFNDKICLNSTSEIAAWLDDAARRHFPDSEYALGSEEWKRRQAARREATEPPS